MLMARAKPQRIHFLILRRKIATTLIQAHFLDGLDESFDLPKFIKLLQMIVDAGQTWNDNALGGWFVYEGDSSVTQASSACEELDGTNLIRMGDFPQDALCATARAFIGKRCDGAIWEMVVCRNDRWSWLGVPATNQIDLIQTITHEFGHALGLDHPDEDEAAAVAPTLNSNGSIRQRQLYKYDVQCIPTLAKLVNSVGLRSSSVYVLIQLSSGQMVQYLWMPHSAVKGSVHLRPPGTGSNILHGTFLSSVSQEQVYGIARGSLLNTIGNTTVAPSDSTIPIITTIYESLHRVYSVVGIIKNWNWNSRTALTGRTYASGITGPRKTSSFGSFNGDKPGIFASADRPSITYDDSAEMTVFAWTHQARSEYDDAEGEVLIALKGIDLDAQPTMMSKVLRTWEKSAAGPAIACETGKAFQNYNCMLVFVPRDEPSPGLRVRYFDVDETTMQLTWSTQTVNLYSEYAVGSPAVWYHADSGRWYIAYIRAFGSSLVEILTSDDGGESWYGSQTLSKSITSPIMNDAFMMVPEKRLSVSY